MDKRKDIPLKEIPETVFDKTRNITYIRGKFLGKGGFARCFELTNSTTKEMMAGKIVSKTLLQKSYQREKMMQEVHIHKDLNHPHVVKLYTCFEDVDNVYITLELCARRSLMELHKRRKAVTEPEARYFTHHVLLALDYLHDKKIIHRDLKLGNLFLNEALQVKIGDFGLATTVANDGERKKTLCGTPNYIAPEVLDKKGHSFEVDIWAVGCILYTLMFGKPPFETSSLKDTYARIKTNTYKIPGHASQQSNNLITILLAAEPARRPNCKEALANAFFNGFMPKRLPVSCLTMAPKFNKEDMQNGLTTHKMTMSASSDPRGVLSPRQMVRQDLMGCARQLNAVPENGAMDVDVPSDGAPNKWYLPDLQRQLKQFMENCTRTVTLSNVEEESPEATPVFWISKWVDYSDKYGIGYQLSDNSVGVLFNDATKLILDEAGNEMTYIEKNDIESYYNLENTPPNLNKKVTLLKYFRTYMNDHLLKAGANMARKDGDDLARLPVLRHWFRTRSAIVLHLSNGTLQINFFDDHTKLIVCPLMGAATYIDERKMFHVYRFSHLEKYGCSVVLMNRLKYSKMMVDRMLNNMNSRPGTFGNDQTERTATGSQRSSAQV